MKNILFTVLTFVSFNLLAQVPQGVGYQGVATDSEGIELVNQSISIKASVLSGSANGTIEWEETHSTSTDTFGLFNLTIGQGNNTGNGVQVNFADISWGTNTHFLKIEMDVTGGNNFTFMGTNQMMSVPYALYAENSTLDTVSIQNIALESSLWVEHPTQNKITSPGKSVGVRGYPGELDSTIDLTIYSSGEEYTPSKIRLKGTNENSSYSSWSDLSSSYDNHITSSKFSISTRNMGVMNENFVINSLGYTGIGTTDPIATLHIEPEFPAKGLLVNTEYANGGIYIQNNANTSAKLVLNQVGSNNGQAYYLVSRNDGQFVIGNANNGIVDMLTIDSLGNIGITEEAPKADLHITDENDFTDVLIESGGDFEDASLWLKNPSKTWRIHGDQNDIDKFKIGLWTDYSEIGGSLLMEYPFVIDTIGRVGVGAPSPNANLHIYNQDSVVLKVQTNSNGQSGAYLRLNEDNTTGGYVHYKSSGDNSNALRLGTATIGNGDLNMLTLRAGNVGVNTDNPQQTLHVNDVMRLEPRETAPEDPSKGDIFMDDADNKLKYFDGENWQILNGNNSTNEILTGESNNVNDILFPEGINGEPIIISLNPTSPYYIVPSDKRLYILNILSVEGDENSEYRILINNNLILEKFDYPNIKQPIIVNSNDVVSSTNNILNFNGILVDKISGIEALTVTVDINQWQVPDGLKYFIQHVISDEFSIDGIEISESLIDEELTLPLVMNEYQTISIPADFNSDDLPIFHGYLVDEDYFSVNNDNSTSSGLDSATVAEMISSSVIKNCNYKFPDGLDGDPIYVDLFENNFTVPEGKNFYLSNWYSNDAAYVVVNGLTISRIERDYQFRHYSYTSQSSLILKAGDIVSWAPLNGENSDYIENIFIYGKLFDQKVDPVRIDIENLYEVPDGKKLFVNYAVASIANLYVNDKFFSEIDDENYGLERVDPIEFKSGDVLSTNDNMIYLFGYIVDEDYFENCQ
jgi:hypothetical protein